MVCPNSATVKPGSLLSNLGHIIQKEHITGLWRGVTPVSITQHLLDIVKALQSNILFTIWFSTSSQSIARCVPGVGLYFSSLHFLSSNLVDDKPGPLQAVALGVFARSFSGICLIPITVVKTRYEVCINF